jgi:hypothetical protein
LNDDQLQRSSSTETSNRRRQLLPEQCATVDAESPNARHHQDGDYAYQGGHTVAEIPAIRK